MFYVLSLGVVDIIGEEVARDNGDNSKEKKQSSHFQLCGFNYISNINVFGIKLSVILNHHFEAIYQYHR